MQMRTASNWKWLGILVFVGLGLGLSLRWALRGGLPEALLMVQHWGPWGVALVTGGALVWVSVFGKLPSVRGTWLCGVLGFSAVVAMGVLGPGRFNAWQTLTSYAPNFSLSALRQHLPSWPEALADGGWAKPEILYLLQEARSQYPTQVKVIDQYVAAWHFWHRDAVRGEAALWRLGLQAELVDHYATRQRWDILEQIAQGNYLAALVETQPSARVEALKILARRAGHQADLQAARRLLLEAFKNSGRLNAEEQDRLWLGVSGGVGQEIGWEEYYRCLRQLAQQAPTPETLGRLVFEMRKLEQLHPELQRDPLPGRDAQGGKL